MESNKGFNNFKNSCDFPSSIYYVIAVLTTIYVKGILENKEDVYKNI